jgi:protein tyrosine/serine phosphatase
VSEETPLERPAPNPKHLGNFGWIEAWLGRGAEPTPAGFHWLQQSGFKTVVNLRAEDDTEAYLEVARQMTHVLIPVADNHAPSDAQMLTWLQLCADPVNRPVFVHCESGHGRTSTFCILVRLAQGVRLRHAIDEQVKHYGFDPKHDRAQIAYLESVRSRLKDGELKLPPL